MLKEGQLLVTEKNHPGLFSSSNHSMADQAHRNDVKYFVTMSNVRNTRISDGCVYAQIRKGLGMHIVTYTNRDMELFLL